MKKYQKIALAVTIIILTYVLWRYFKRRQDVSRLCNKLHLEGIKYKPKCNNPACINNHIDNIEGFGTPEAELESVKSTDTNTITSIGSEYTYRPLKDYVIKSSYNSVVTGDNVNVEMITYLLSRGCRLLDFEILNIDNKPFVTYTTNPELTTINTENKVLLDNVLAKAVSQAFTQPCPNYEDPLFIHLRIKANGNAELYKYVAKSIYATLKAKLYQAKITRDTKMADVMGKVVIIMDKSINRNYETESACKPGEKECYNLSKGVNLESSSDNLYNNTYSDVLGQSFEIVNILNNCSICTDVRHYRLVLPDIANNASNPDTYELIGRHGCQLVTNRFYIKDSNLEKYEKLFHDNKAGIIPLAHVVDYIKKQPTSPK